MSTCVLIPAFNEARSIGPLLDAVKRKLGSQDVCVVVDDCSRDDTRRIVEGKGVKLLTQPRHMGKGKALRSGFRYVLERDFELVLNLDGDGQHDPEDIPRFIQRAEEGPFDLVVGDRMHDPKGMPLLRRLTNQVLSALVSKRAGVRIADSQCGFRLIRRRVIEALDFSSSKFEIDSEILTRTARAGFRIGTLPIRSIYGQEESRIRPVRDGLRFFRFYFKDSHRS